MQMERFSAFGGEAFLLLGDVRELEEKAAFEKALSEVSNGRREKALRLSGKGRLCSLGAGLVFAEGARALGFDSSSLSLCYGRNEKPYLAGQEFSFNLSHSGTKVLGIFSSREVGCDIQQREEKEKTRSREAGIYRRFFHREEITFLDGLAEGERREAFYALWALKEAYVKAGGEGLSCPFDSFWIDPLVPEVREGEKRQLGRMSLPGYELAWARMPG